MSVATESVAVPAQSDIESKVLEQYDTDASMHFYEFIMGGGGDDIHVRSPTTFTRGSETAATIVTIASACSTAFSTPERRI